jgi:ribose 5-phosphate isomerase B
MKIALATDHTGIDDLNLLSTFLKSLKHEVIDYGPKSLDLYDDYPDFMFKAAHAVASKSCDMGIILGGSGQGEAMAANRIKGVRCAVFYGPMLPKQAVDIEGHASHDPYEILHLSRLHNDSNILSLAARFLDIEQMKQAVETWLDTPFSNEARHLRRIHELDNE